MINQSELLELASQLVVPTLRNHGSVTIANIREGVEFMSGGKLTSRPLAKERILDESRLHNTYALFYKAERVGQIYIDTWPWTGNTVLRDGVAAALTAFPTNRIVFVGAGLQVAFNNVAHDKTQYDKVYIGPALPLDYLVA